MNLNKDSAQFRTLLAGWFVGAQRALPWRVERSLYRTVVSELMAQQTQIKTMLPYFERWMQRFPDFEALAAAPSEDVLKHWEGLGYYSRARNLHKLAQCYVRMDPKPDTRAAWESLPGIGPYTSAAISSIALGQPEAVVDGNVVRILARLTDDARVFKNNGAAVAAFRSTAEAVLDPENPGRHNEAMMELGATICLKHSPLCTVCPVLEFCASARKGSQALRPRIERKATEKIELERAWVVSGKKVLLHRIPETAGQLAGQYELPELHAVGGEASQAELRLTRTRSITHRRIRERIYAYEPKQPIAAPLEWVRLSELDRITLSGPHRRWIKELLEI